MIFFYYFIFSIAAATEIYRERSKDQLWNGLSSFNKEESRAPNSERSDRMVDAAALEIEQHGIALLEALLPAAKNTPKEPELVLKIVESLHESSHVEFRIAHGKANLNNTKINLTHYIKNLNQLITYCVFFIKKFPNHKDADEITFLRAAAHEELGKVNPNIQNEVLYLNEAKAEQGFHFIASAGIDDDEVLLQALYKKMGFSKLKEVYHLLLSIRDYKIIIEHYPQSRFSVDAYLAVGEYWFNANQYRKAITYYSMIIQNQNQNQNQKIKSFPLALYKIAWSYFNLNEISLAMKNMIDHYRSLKKMEQEEDKDHKGHSSVDQILQERALKDYAEFYFKGIQLKTPGCSYQNAADAFLEIETSDQIAVGLYHFAQLLRLNKLLPELYIWKNICIKRFSQMAVTFRIVQTTAEIYFFQNKMEQVYECCHDIRKLKKGLLPEHEAALYKTPFMEEWISIAERLYQINLKIKPILENQEILYKNRQLLAEIYLVYLFVAQSTDSKTYLVCYNLAITFELIQRYDEATAQYRFLAQHWDLARGPIRASHPSPPVTQNILYHQAIKTRYQSLLVDKLIPNNIKPCLMEGLTQKPIPVKMEEWIEWIDALSKSEKKISQELETEIFETNRIYYAYGYVDKSFQRISYFVEKIPYSSNSLSGISLILDTMVLNKKWKEVLQYIDTFTVMLSLYKKNKKINSFLNNLKILASESMFNLIEKNYKEKNFEVARDYLKDFFEKYPNNKKTSHALLLAAQMEWNQGNLDASYDYVKKLLATEKRPFLTKPAYLLAAQIDTLNFEYARAFKYYAFFLKIDSTFPDQKVPLTERESILKRMVDYRNILSQNRPLVNCSDQGIWTSVQQLCESSLAMDVVLQHGVLSQAQQKNIDKQAQTANDRIKGIFLLASFNQMLFPKVGNQKGLVLRMQALEKVVKSFDSIEMISRYQLMPFFTELVLQEIDHLQQQVEQQTPLALNAVQIKKRAALLTTFEVLLDACLNVHNSLLRLKALAVIAEAHRHFADELEGLIPQKLSEEEKKNAKEEIVAVTKPLREKALQTDKNILTLLQNTSVRPEDIKRILPKLVITGIPINSVACSSQLKDEKVFDASFLDGLHFKNEIGKKMLKKLIQATDEKRFAEAVFLLLELQSENQLKEADISLIYGLILESMHAHAEAIEELNHALPQIGSSLFDKIRSYLIFDAALRGNNKETDRLCHVVPVKEKAQPSAEVQ